MIWSDNLFWFLRRAGVLHIRFSGWRYEVKASVSGSVWGVENACGAHAQTRADIRKAVSPGRQLWFQ
jgi:hypothetical protein